MRSSRFPFLALPLLLAALSLGSGAARAESSTKLAEELARLRADVEAISEELELERAATREELASLAARKAELEAELQREELRLRRIEAAVLEQQKLVETARKSEAGLVPVVLDAAADLRTFVEGSLPFRKAERLASIDQLRADLEGGTLRPSKAAMRLWGLVQDELRLTRESGMYRQPIVLGEGEHLADVVRVGMVMLFFQTSDGRVGRAREEDGAWRYEVLSRDDDVRQVRRLFDSFHKQVRVGLFEVPAALPEEGSR